MKNFFRAVNHHFELGKKTYIMGILNVTPDSFSDGGMWCDHEKALTHAIEMEKLGADVIDIGAQSTRPGHKAMSPQEEIERLGPILMLIKNNINLPISVDTYYPSVAREAIELGASIINDVSGFVSSEMANIVAGSGAGWIIMHTGCGMNPLIKEDEISIRLETLMKDRRMVAARQYENGIAKSIKNFFEKAFFAASGEGVKDECICFDCGIGFGKSYEQNIELLRDIKLCRFSNYPLLVANSRKRFIGETTGVTEPSQRLAGTLAADTIAICGGADFIRVHDVKNAVQMAKMADAIYKSK